MARHRLADALLESAALAHREAAALVDDRRRHFDDAFSEYNRGIGCELYVSACTDDVSIGEAGQPAAGVGRGAVCDVLEEDIEAGVRFSVEAVVAGRELTIVEGSFVNPVDDPFHCPPAMTQVYRHDGESIRAISLYFAAR